MPQMLSLTGRLILIGRLGDDQAACGSGGDVFDLSQWTAEKGTGSLMVTVWSMFHECSMNHDIFHSKKASIIIADLSDTW